MRYKNKGIRLLIYVLMTISAMIRAEAERKTDASNLEEMPWVAFINAEDLGGFKDLQGNIRIEPKYRNLSDSMRFKNIIAVTEARETGKDASYYLLKNGQKVAENSLYVYDNGFDCESEASIRFRDPSNGNVGFLDAQGKVLIPAIYSDARPFRNGLALVLKNAQRMCEVGKEYSEESPCEHWHWMGGSTLLIDKNNNIVINGSIYESGLDWYSLEISNQPSQDLLRESFLGVSGEYYSFISFKDAFEQWLFRDFLANLSKTEMLKNSYQTITYWSEAKDGWIDTPRDDFFTVNYAVLAESLSKLKNSTVNFMYSITPLNKSIYEGEEYAQYFDDCGEPKEWQYPVFELVLTHREEGRVIQDIFEFLKTEQGYKLLSVTLRNNTLH